jgi:hypothetical protein
LRQPLGQLAGLGMLGVVHRGFVGAELHDLDIGVRMVAVLGSYRPRGGPPTRGLTEPVLDCRVELVGLPGLEVDGLDERSQTPPRSHSNGAADRSFGWSVVGRAAAGLGHGPGVRGRD